MADFGKLNFAVSFNPQTAFPLDARYYFSSLSAAEAAAATAVEVGSSDGTYFYGENVCVVTESSADLYIIQPDKTLKAVGSAVLGDGKSIEIVDGKVALKGFGSATAGQQPRINAAGTAIEWYTPDTSTVSGLADTVAGHTQDIQNLQTGKADKATTLEGYGITDAMTATAIAEAIKTAIAETGHASFTKVDAVPAASEAKDNVLYLVMNADTGFYDIYAKVGTEVVRLDDVSVNLDNYSTTEQMNEAIPWHPQTRYRPNYPWSIHLPQFEYFRLESDPHTRTTRSLRPPARSEQRTHRVVHDADAQQIPYYGWTPRIDGTLPAYADNPSEL